MTCTETKDELFKKLRIILDNCREHKMSIHKGKLIIGESIDFAGFTLNQQGVLPDKEMVDAIRNFPPPKSVTEVRSFLGLANQLGNFVENMAALSEAEGHPFKMDQ